MPDRIGRRWSALLAGALACLLFAVEARACIRTGADATDKPAFAHPVPGAIQSTFGIRFHPLLNAQRAHNGIDYVAAVGDQVQAAPQRRALTYSGS
jgi:murein DD-endopeptidase MepM/ murein hydrolase activator NlpD